MCQTKDLPIRDWVKLAVNRARATGHAAIFWLDENRAYDRNVIEKAQQYLKDHDTIGSRHPHPVAGRRDPRDAEARARRTSTRSRSPATCCATTSPTCSRSSSSAPARRCCRSCRCSRAAGCTRPAPAARRRSTCSSSCRRTTCAGIRSASSSRWPCRSRTSARRPATPARRVVADALDTANGQILENDKSPQRKVGELDNRGSHFYLAMYWARALADQTRGPRAAAPPSRRSRSSSSSNEQTIVARAERRAGHSPSTSAATTIPIRRMTAAAMRPSATLNRIVDSM